MRNDDGNEGKADMKDESQVNAATDAGGSSSTVPTMENYARSLAHAASGEEMTLIVTFFLEGDEYAFDVTDAFEVLKPGRLTRVPNTPVFIKGIISVRGEMVPVLDIKRRLGLASSSTDYAHSRVMIAGTEDHKAGFLVDGVGGVKEFKARLFRPSGKDGGFLKATLRTDSSFIKVLDIERLLDMEGR